MRHAGDRHERGAQVVRDVGDELAALLVDLRELGLAALLQGVHPVHHHAREDQRAEDRRDDQQEEQEQHEG